MSVRHSNTSSKSEQEHDFITKRLTNYNLIKPKTQIPQTRNFTLLCFSPLNIIFMTSIKFKFERIQKSGKTLKMSSTTREKCQQFEIVSIFLKQFPFII